MNPEVLADYSDLCGESPVWDARDQVLYWTDITGTRFYQYSWYERRAGILNQGFEVAGVALQENGGFVVANSSGFWLWDAAGAPRLIAGEAEGRKCQLNDCVADPEGRMFAGSCFWDPSRTDSDSGCLFRLEANGSVHVADDGIQLSNGLGFSPDLSTLYYADSAARCIYAYDYQRVDGSIRNRRVLVRVPRERGIPDGLTVDADGFLWCAHWFGSGLYRYDPDGALERHVPIPAAQTSSVMFGGPELTDIFVTSAGLPDALPLAPDGYDASRVYSGGKMFHLNLGIRGKEEFRTRISMRP